MFLKLSQLMIIDKVKNAFNIEKDLLHRNYCILFAVLLFSALVITCKLPGFETRINHPPYAHKKNKS